MELKVRLLHAALVAMGYVAIYGVCRHFFDIGRQFAMYTPSWTVRNVIWGAAVISTVPSLFGSYRFSLITLAGYIMGVVAGELLGGFRSDVPPRYPHYGWAIWAATFALSIVIGLLAESAVRRRHRTR